MDMKKTGQLIGMLRKERGMTQRELAEKINVTDKAVSRWETGKGFPEPSTLKPLAEVLGTSITALVNGERDSAGAGSDTAEKAVLEALEFTRQAKERTQVALLLVMIVLTALLPFYIPFQLRGLYLFFCAGIVGGLVLGLLFRGVMGSTRLSKRANSLVSVVALCAALISEILPVGAVLVFAPNADTRVRETFSYFSLTPFGYGNFFYLAAAWLTVFTLATSIFCLISKRGFLRLSSGVFAATVTAFVCSVLAVALSGFANFSPVGLSISTLLAFSGIYQFFAGREKE